MNECFSGNIQVRTELFERELTRYVTRASETISLNQRMVLSGLDSRPLKDKLLLNSSKDPAWQGFKTEIANRRRATAVMLSAAPVRPMDVGALSKG